MIGFDTKKAAKLFAASAKKDRLYVDRDAAGVLTITNGEIVVIGSESNLWSIVKAFPFQLPPDVGTHPYRNGEYIGMLPSIVHTMSRHIDQAKVNVEDTQLTTYTKDYAVRLLAPCSMVGEYTVIQERYHELFAGQGVDYRRGTKASSPVAVFAGDVSIGVIMPVVINVNRFLRVLPTSDQASTHAAD